jgi:hypothetical protein
MQMTLMSLLMKPQHHPPPSHAGEGAAAFLAAGFLFVVGIITLFFVGIIFASWWRIFTKAGQPGWMALIPILNILTLLKIVNKPLWWVVGFCIPGVSFVMHILLALEVAKAFGQGTGFAVGLIFLPIVFYPILAFSSATYMGAAQPGMPVQAPGYGY